VLVLLLVLVLENSAYLAVEVMRTKIDLPHRTYGTYATHRTYGTRFCVVTWRRALALEVARPDR